MITHWFLFCFVHNLVAQQTTPVPSKGGIDIKTKPVMCDYKSSGPNGLMDPTIPELSADCFPCECEVIVFEEFSIDNTSSIFCDTKLLQALTSVKPVIVGVYRENHYNEWAFVLNDDKILAKEVATLIDFAKKNNVMGFRLSNLVPDVFMDTFDIIVGKKIVGYIKKLKENTNLIVGYSVKEFESVIDNECVTPFVELNAVVDFYTFRTDAMNVCKNEVYNGLSPIKLMPHGDNYMLSLEEVWKFIKASKCDLAKIYLIVDLLPMFSPKFVQKNKYYESYNKVCTGIKAEEMCIPDTNQFYAKGKYIKEVGCGITIRFVNLDNFENDCGGCGFFIGTKNVIVGYNGKEKIPCAKFDVQKSPNGLE